VSTDSENKAYPLTLTIKLNSNLQVTPDLHGWPPMSSGKKIRMRAILKENMANYISLERLINVDFGKKI